MKKIEIFVGSDSAFEKIVPKSARNLSEMAAKLDDGNKKMDVFVNIPGQPEPKSKKKKKPRVQDFIIHADEYCSVQEHTTCFDIIPASAALGSQFCKVAAILNALRRSILSPVYTFFLCARISAHFLI